MISLSLSLSISSRIALGLKRTPPHPPTTSITFILLQGEAAAKALETLAAHLTPEDTRVLFDPLNRPMPTSQ